MSVNHICEGCGVLLKELEDVSAHHCEGGQIVSDPEATLDELVAEASRPNLASLFRQAKQEGLIKPVTGYTSVA